MTLIMGTDMPTECPIINLMRYTSFGPYYLIKAYASVVVNSQVSVNVYCLRETSSIFPSGEAFSAMHMVGCFSKAASLMVL